MLEIVKDIHWLGHDAFRIDGEKVVYIDPYQIKDGPKADIILVSHEHFDHCSPEDIQKIRQATTIIVTEKGSAKKLKGDVRTIKPGESILIDKVKIEAVPSYNIDKQFHLQKNGWLGFVLEINGVRIYHAGDTDFIPEMKNLKVDIALLPVSGTYVMTADQAAKAALAIKPKLAIPMHYGAIVGSVDDAIQFKESLVGKVEVEILNKE